MAREDTLIDRIRSRVAHYDDESLVTLANKGLVRRATKDLESLSPSVLGYDGHAVTVAVGEFRVRVPESVPDATCSCVSKSICRHVLAAIMYLRESAPLQEKTRSCRDEILALSDEDLRKWAGKAMLDKAGRVLSEGISVEAEEAATLLLRIPARNVTCRWVPGAGPEGMVCACGSKEACRHKVLAILGYQVLHGCRTIDREERIPLQTASETPRSQAEVLESVGAVLAESLVTGLSRLSKTTEQRLRTLAVSAHGMDLPRLERLLNSLADEVGLWLNRDAQSSLQSFLVTASRVEALITALRSPGSVVAGEHRSSYHPVGTIEIMGLGARQWQTRSGYVGITVYFWDFSSKSWATWTDSRPKERDRFNPVSVYRGPGPWEGCLSPYEASRNKLMLTEAWRNPSGRISGRPGTKAMTLTPSDAGQAGKTMESWAEAAELAAVLFSGGMAVQREQHEIVLLKPATWGEAEYESTRQELNRPVFDRDGRVMLLKLSYNPFNAAGIDALEAYTPSVHSVVLGLLRMGPGGFFVEPVSLHVPGSVFNLTLDAGNAKAKREKSYLSPPGLDGNDLDSQLTGTQMTPIGLLLSSLAALLESWAEQGVGSAVDLTHFLELLARADSVGLSSVADAGRKLAMETERLRKSVATDFGSAGKALLRCYYVCTAASIQETLTRCASL